jgi:hypothetical protein
MATCLLPSWQLRSTLRASGLLPFLSLSLDLMALLSAAHALTSNRSGPPAKQMSALKKCKIGTGQFPS